MSKTAVNVIRNITKKCFFVTLIGPKHASRDVAETSHVMLLRRFPLGAFGPLLLFSVPHSALGSVLMWWLMSVRAVLVVEVFVVFFWRVCLV